MDAVASSERHRDVAYERCVKKVVIAIFSKEGIKKTIWASFFSIFIGIAFLCSYKESCLLRLRNSVSVLLTLNADRAKHQVKNNHAASMSEDEAILIMATNSRR